MQLLRLSLWQLLHLPWLEPVYLLLLVWELLLFIYHGKATLPVLTLILTGVCQICPTQNVRNNQIWTLNSADLKYMYVHNAYKPSLVIIVRREMGNGTPRHVGHQCPTGWNEEWYNCLASLVMILLYILCGSFPSVADCNYFGPTMPGRGSLPAYSRFLKRPLTAFTDDSYVFCDINIVGHS